MTTHIVKWGLILVAAGMLGACGSKETPSAAINAGSAGAGESSKVSATAEEVAEEKRDGVRCPAKIKTPVRDAKAPVDDVVGVRPGMTYEEAANVALCTNELLVLEPENSRGFQIQSYGQTIRQGFNVRFAQAKVEKTSKQIMQEMQDNAMARGMNRRAESDVKPGQSKWFIATMGAPGQERVINVAREEWFEEGRNPTMASVEQALLKKYGTPTKSQPQPTVRVFTWAYDPLGRLVTETSPLITQCNTPADPDGGVNLSPDCGIVVAAMVYSMQDNPDLAKYFQVGAIDQAKGYEAITATEQALQQADAQRRAKQVESAAENADAPQL